MEQLVRRAVQAGPAHHRPALYIGEVPAVRPRRRLRVRPRPARPVARRVRRPTGGLRENAQRSGRRAQVLPGECQFHRYRNF